MLDSSSRDFDTIMINNDGSQIIIKYFDWECLGLTFDGNIFKAGDKFNLSDKLK